MQSWRGPGIGSTSAIVLGDWKLIYYHDPDRERFQLYNLADDLSEQTNLAATHREKLRELAARLQHELIRTDAQMPTISNTGEQVPWPADVLGTLDGDGNVLPHRP